MKKKIVVCLLLLWMCFIFYMSAQAGSASSNISNSFLNLIKSFLRINVDFINGTTIRKMAHFFEYTVLGILSTVVFKVYFNKNYLFAIIFSCLYAVTDELHQYFVPGRACSVLDMLLDSCGCLLGFLLVFIFLKNKNEKRNK